MSGFLNYTTKIPADQTLGEIQRMLGKAGASAVATMYEAGSAVGVNFQMDTATGPATFALPVNTAGVRAALARTKPNGGISLAAYRSPEQAERVAWRVVKDWLEAQLALIEAGMAQLDTVMLPYLLVDGRTLADRYLERGQLLLEGGAGRG